MSQITEAKKDLKKYEDLKKRLQALRIDLVEDRLPFPIEPGRTAKINLDGIDDVLNLVLLCAESLEAHIDDLSNEKE
jgi:hypothetical protein